VLAEAPAALQAAPEAGAAAAAEADAAAAPGPAAWGLDKTTGALLLAVLAVLYGANTPLLKSVDSVAPLDLTSTELVALRFITAAAPLLPCLLLSLGSTWRALRPGLELGFWLWVAYSLQILGLEKLPASVATVLFALCGLMVQALDFALDGKPLSPAAVLSSLGALLGLVVFVTAPSGVREEETVGLFWVFAASLRKALEGLLKPAPAPHEALLRDVPGEALVLLGTFFFAVHVWRSAALVPGAAPADEGQEAEGEDTSFGLALGAVQLVVCAVLGVGLGLLDSTHPGRAQLAVVAGLDAGVWQRVAACGVLCTALPQTLELFALQVTPPAQAALIYCTIPVWGTALSVLLLGDPLAPQAVAGAALIVLCSLPWGEAAGGEAAAGAE